MRSAPSGLQRASCALAMLPCNGCVLIISLYRQCAPLVCSVLPSSASSGFSQRSAPCSLADEHVSSPRCNEAAAAVTEPSLRGHSSSWHLQLGRLASCAARQASQLRSSPCRRCSLPSRDGMLWGQNVVQHPFCRLRRARGQPRWLPLAASAAAAPHSPPMTCSIPQAPFDPSYRRHGAGAFE